MIEVSQWVMRSLGSIPYSSGPLDLKQMLMHLLVQELQTFFCSRDPTGLKLVVAVQALEIIPKNQNTICYIRLFSNITNNFYYLLVNAKILSRTFLV